MIRLLLTSGRGPAECRIALKGMLGILVAEADVGGLDCDVACAADPDGFGPPSAVLVIDGGDAEDFAGRWIGTLKWIAESPVRPNHKRKNWFVGCSRVAAPGIPAAALNASEVRFEAFRAGGPGGQHQNKTESAVRAVHIPTGVSVVVRDGRSQHRNKAIAVERLGALIKLRETMAEREAASAAHAHHDLLERGRANRTFRGARFQER